MGFLAFLAVFFFLLVAIGRRIFGFRPETRATLAAAGGVCVVMAWAVHAVT